jgi:FkbM family methyltransferase
VKILSQNKSLKKIRDSAQFPKEPLLYKGFYLMNGLWKHAYPVYRLLYWYYKRISDRNLLAVIRNTVKPGNIVLDIGANVGFFTIELSNLVGPNGIVHAFEPDPDNFMRLKQTVKNRANVVANQCAVADKSGTIKLYQSNCMNVDHQTYDNGESRSFSEVMAVAIDDYFQKNECVDFIKIDVQGFDCHAMQGLASTIRHSPKVTVIGELWPFGLKKAGKSSREYLELLARLELSFSVMGHSDPDYWHSLPAYNVSYTYFIGQK